MKSEAAMPKSEPVSMLCIYQVKKGKEKEFQDLLARHWPTLDEMSLVSSQAPKFFRGEDKQGHSFFIETFQWKEQESSDVAHQTPEVMQVWEPMGALTEGMQFIRTEPLPL